MIITSVTILVHPPAAGISSFYSGLRAGEPESPIPGPQYGKKGVSRLVLGQVNHRLLVLPASHTLSLRQGHCVPS